MPPKLLILANLDVVLSSLFTELAYCSPDICKQHIRKTNSPSKIYHCLKATVESSVSELEDKFLLLCIVSS